MEVGITRISKSQLTGFFQRVGGQDARDLDSGANMRGVPMRPDPGVHFLLFGIYPVFRPQVATKVIGTG